MVASASIFAALFAVLGTIPLSKLVLGSGFLSASKIIAPLTGMLFGPVTGSVSALVGDLIDVGAGYIAPNAFGLPTVAADLAVVITAGLAFSGRRKVALGFPLVILVGYLVDPLSLLFVGPVPFVWLHAVSFIILGGVLALEARGRIGRFNPLFVSGVAFASLLCGQLTGTLAGQSLQVRVYQIYTPAVWDARLAIVFAVYPLERIFFSIAGSLVAIPVLRAVIRIPGKNPKAS